MPSEKDILKLLEEVKDPEIPVISLIDLGVITEVSTDDSDMVKVSMTPTFVGCPATEVMKKEIEQVLEKNGIRHEVNITFSKPWSSDMISEKGRKALKKFGLAPPQKLSKSFDLDIIRYARCPRCNGENTEMKSPFGPTLCRSLHYCNDCREAFEQFKPL